MRGNTARGIVERREQRVVPLERREIHELRAARVRDVRDVQAAVASAGQIPEQPASRSCRTARRRARRARARPGTWSSSQRSFRPLKYVASGRPVRARKRSRPPSRAKPRRGPRRACPAKRARCGAAARAAIPEQRRLALIRDADRGEVAGVQTLARERAADHVLRVAPDLERVVLDPAGLRVDLRVLLLRARDDRADACRTR